MIYKGLPYATESIESKSIQIAIFVGQRFIVTRHYEKSQEIKVFGQELQRCACS